MSEKTLPAPDRSQARGGPLQGAVPLTGWGRTAPTPAVTADEIAPVEGVPATGSTDTGTQGAQNA